MSTYKDFEGKTLDDAIRQACDYFGVAREKLEIDIVNDAKTGIFGLVGAKKACIRAARVHIGDEVSSLLTVPVSDAPGDSDSAHPAAKKASDKDEIGTRSAPKPAKETKERGQRNRGAHAPESDKAKPSQKGLRPEKASPSDDDADGRRPARPSSAAHSGSEPGQGKTAPESPRKPRGQRGTAAQPGRQKNAGKPAPAAPEKASPPSSGNLPADAHPREELPDFVLEGCDEAMLFSVVREVVGRLINPIVGEVPCSSEIAGNRVRVAVDCGDASALLVGREGQTLASIQYLASRIIAKRIGGALRLQIDAGNYRERQDDKLKELALALAQKAKATGRAQSTRPLSAYQRRIVHLALEADDGVHTYSKGDGPQRRVVIQQQGNGPKQDARHERAEPPAQDASFHTEDALPGGEATEVRGPGDMENTGPASG